MKLSISITVAASELKYLNANFVKSYNLTLNTLISKFRTGELLLGNEAGKIFEKGEKAITIKFTPENLQYIESIKIASKSHTIRLLIWFASQQIKA